MSLDPGIAAAGLAVGVLVGLTGMGGGALTTPLLILVFRVPPLLAVGSDLVAALVMKLVGGGVHVRKGTVHWPIVRHLAIGAVPATFAGVGLLALMDASHVESVVTKTLGAALLLAAAAMAARTWLGRGRKGGPTVVRPGATVAVGAFIGLLVGVTSVGSGSLVVASLLLLYPRLSLSEVVGTDLVQAALLVGAAAVGHLLFGAVHFGVTSSLLLGAIPGTVLGARLSAGAADRFLRPVMFAVLVATGLKML